MRPTQKASQTHEYLNDQVTADIIATGKTLEVKIKAPAEAAEADWTLLRLALRVRDPVVPEKSRPNSTEDR